MSPKSDMAGPPDPREHDTVMRRAVLDALRFDAPHGLLTEPQLLRLLEDAYDSGVGTRDAISRAIRDLHCNGAIERVDQHVRMTICAWLVGELYGA